MQGSQLSSDSSLGMKWTIQDIMENFLYQLCKYQETLPSIPEDVKYSDKVFNVDHAWRLLEQLDKFVPAEPSKVSTSK